MRSRKAYKQRHLMTQLAEGAALLPSDERWDIWRGSALAAVTKKGGNHLNTPSSLCLMKFTVTSADPFLQSRARGAGMATHSAPSAKS